MFRWLIGAAIVASMSSAVIGTYVYKRQRTMHLQRRVSIEAFAEKLVRAAALRAPYRDTVRQYIVDTYATKRAVPIHQRHPSHVLYHMAKHPHVRRHIEKTMRISDDALAIAKSQSDAIYDTILKGKVMYYGNMLTEGFDAYNDTEILVDRQGTVRAVRGARFPYFKPSNNPPSLYPEGYMRPFALYYDRHEKRP